MKQFVRKPRGLVKGTPSAILLSALIHFILLFVAGGLVIFSVIKKQEKKFVPPPPVERPKMELKKPRVKVRKSAKPRATQRIVTKSARQGLPEIQLPEISGMSAGLSGGIGGFEMMPDPAELTMFGGKTSMAIGNDFEGTFYSMEYDRRNKKTGISDEGYLQVLRRFTENEWNPNVFARYYRAPQKLYATQIMIPPVSSEFGPSQFGMGFGRDFDPIHWCVHYTGKIARKKAGRFRFCGLGDDILLVRVDGRIVLNAGWGGPTHPFQDITDFRNTSTENGKYFLGHSLMSVGDWVDLEPGTPVDMEVLIGEVPGGIFAAMLLVQEEGVKYPTKQDGGPTLPVFKTAEMPEQVKEQIQYTLIEGEADLNGGPMFNVY